MQLYLIRHGEAEGPEKPEAERALTEEGLETVRKIASHVTSHASAPTHLFISPLKRAQQTAEFFADAWQLSGETADWLLPSTPASIVLEQLAQRNTPAALVGHLPNLGLVLSSLVWGMPAREISIPKGGTALLEVTGWEPGAAKLRWLLSPDTL
jgi:phosphohistidine phosphatase